MITMERFANELMMELAVLLPNVKVETQDVVKENGTHLTGLVFTGDTFPAPTFYLEDIYSEDVSEKSDVAEIARELANRYAEATGPDVGIIFAIRFYEDAKERLTFRTLEVERNTELIKNRVSFELGCGLAAFPDIVTQNGDDGQFRTAITPAIMETWGIDMETLKRDVMLKAPCAEPPTFYTITSGIFGTPENLLGKEKLDSVESMYVLSNQDGIMGASALFYPTIQNKIHSLIGDYYVLPCSINEVIIVPESANVSVEDLRSMVYSANRSVVDGKELLSDNVYHYASGKLEVA